jgi:hypothetical protein
MSTHTPGPWKFALFEHAPNEAFVQWRAGYAEVHGSRAGREANARLIAAAPDLLAALQALVDLDDGDSPALWAHSGDFERARAAIAKATGGTP